MKFLLDCKCEKLVYSGHPSIVRSKAIITEYNMTMQQSIQFGGFNSYGFLHGQLERRANGLAEQDICRGSKHSRLFYFIYLTITYHHLGLVSCIVQMYQLNSHRA